MRLRDGEEAFEDEASEARDKSLGASLSYGFEHAFSEAERKQLALLHFFQGFVDVKTLCFMGTPAADWCLPEVRGLTRETGIALLDRASEVGLLTALGSGYYSIHPALPWFFRSLFSQYYFSLPTSGAAPELKATRAFAETMGQIGNYYLKQYSEGNSEVIGALSAEEPNLLHGRRLSRAHGWGLCVLSMMQGLIALYDHTGRRAEWARLVNEIVPDFVDPANEGPIPGREYEWSIVTGYRVKLAMKDRQWVEAERLQRVCIDWARQDTASALALPPEELDAIQRNRIRSLAVSLVDLAEILSEQAKPECIAAYEEGYELELRVGDRHGAARTSHSLGNAHLSILGDLERAEYWYHHSLEMIDERDRMARGQCLAQLGNVAHSRFIEAQNEQQPEAEIVRHLNDAARFYYQALDLTPENAIDVLAGIQCSLGVIHRSSGDLNRALPHYRNAIRNFEAVDNLYEAAKARYNVANALASAGRFADAREYAYAALRNYETYGDRAADKIQKTQELIEQIEEDLQIQGD
jgi:tetratricopeptide (TPR) repeat protein